MKYVLPELSLSYLHPFLSLYPSVSFMKVSCICSTHMLFASMTLLDNLLQVFTAL